MPRLCDFSPPSAVILVQCHCEASAHTGCGNPLPIPSAPLPKGGWHGEVVTGGFFSAPHLLSRFVGAGFYPARSSAPLVTDAGRCGERTERCQWQRKRGERVAAVKILSDSRKAAQKFWAPQQGHRPLRNPIGKPFVGADASPRPSFSLLQKITPTRVFAGRGSVSKMPRRVCRPQAAKK